MTSVQTGTQMSSDLLLTGVAFEVGLHQSVVPERGEKQGARTQAGRQDRAAKQCSWDPEFLFFFRIKIKNRTKMGKIHTRPGINIAPGSCGWSVRALLDGSCWFRSQPRAGGHWSQLQLRATLLSLVGHGQGCGYGAGAGAGAGAGLWAAGADAWHSTDPGSCCGGGETGRWPQIAISLQDQPRRGQQPVEQQSAKLGRSSQRSYDEQSCDLWCSSQWSYDERSCDLWCSSQRSCDERSRDLWRSSQRSYDERSRTKGADSSIMLLLFLRTGAPVGANTACLQLYLREGVRMWARTDGWALVSQVAVQGEAGWRTANIGWPLGRQLGLAWQPGTGWQLGLGWLQGLAWLYGLGSQTELRCQDGIGWQDGPGLHGLGLHESA